MKILIFFLIITKVILTSECFIGRRFVRNLSHLDDDSDEKLEVDSMNSDRADESENSDHLSGNLHRPFWNSFRLSRKFNLNRPVFFKPKTRAPQIEPKLTVKKQLPSTTKPLINNDPQPPIPKQSKSIISPKKISKLDKKLIPTPKMPTTLSASRPTTTSTTSSTTTTTTTTTTPTTTPTTTSTTQPTTPSTTTPTTTTTSSTTTSTTRPTRSSTTTTTESPPVTGSILIVSSDSDADLGFDFTTSMITESLLTVN